MHNRQKTNYYQTRIIFKFFIFLRRVTYDFIRVYALLLYRGSLDDSCNKYLIHCCCHVVLDLKLTLNGPVSSMTMTDALCIMVTSVDV